MIPSFLDELLQLPCFRGSSEVDETAIQNAERALGTQFADDYWDYTAAFGFASANGHELTGVCKFPRLNVVDVTIAERNQGHNEQPDWYVIERIGVDGALAWQNSRGKVFLTKRGAKPAVIAGSLIEYLKQ